MIRDGKEGGKYLLKLVCICICILFLVVLEVKWKWGVRCIRNIDKWNKGNGYGYIYV